MRRCTFVHLPFITFMAVILQCNMYVLWIYCVVRELLILRHQSVYNEWICIKFITGALRLVATVGSSFCSSHTRTHMHACTHTHTYVQTTTIPAHQRVGLSTLDITPIFSIRSNSCLTFSRRGSVNCQLSTRMCTLRRNFPSENRTRTIFVPSWSAIFLLCT